MRAVSSVCLTEQDEPVVLLPDYLAGASIITPSRALNSPVVSRDTASAAVADFAACHQSCGSRTTISTALSRSVGSIGPRQAQESASAGGMADSAATWLLPGSPKAPTPAVVEAA
jgi:hypothetical protein